MTEPSPRAQLIKSLDEKYVADSVVFASMCAAGTLIVDGAPLRGPDGELDRAAIRSRIERLSWFAPSMRQRLVHTPLRATTPAWVPVDRLDLEYHVRFHAGVEPDDPGVVDALTGRDSPVLDLDRPLWDLVFVPLDSGRVAIVLRYHHVVGDALFGLRIGDVLAGTAQQSTAPEPGDAEREVVGVAPRTGFGVLTIAWRDWRGRQGSVRDGWRAYWRKPFRMRVRRWGGRLLRPLKNARIARTGMVEAVRRARSSQYVVLDFAAVTKRAYRLGGTVNDLLAAAALRAVADQREGADSVSILVPISRRARGDGEVRNDVSIVKVSVPASATVEEMLPLVREQVQRAVDSGGSIVEGAEDWVGFATFVTLGRDQRWFGDAPLETLVGWPAGDPRDDLAVLACAYRRELVVSATVRDSIDRPALMRSIEQSLSVPAERSARV